jgi:hypothetical protein
LGLGLASYVLGSVFVAYYDSGFRYVTFHIPFWINSDYDFDLLTAMLSYFFFYAVNPKSAFAWFLLYDSVYELSTFPLIQLNGATVLIFMVAMLCFYFLKIPIKNKVPIILFFISIWGITMIGHSAHFQILVAWSIFLIASQVIDV